MPKLTPYMEKKIKKQKEKILTQLSTTPIIAIACSQCSLARATYYRWIKEDTEFKNNADLARAKGVELINDVAESNVLEGIKNKDYSYTRLWLIHRHPEFNTVVKVKVPEWDEIMKHFVPPEWLFPFRNDN